MLSFATDRPMYDGLHVTREEYLDLREDGYRYDMIDGVLHMSPSAFFEHNDVLSEMISCFRVFLKANGAGRAVVETDVFLPDGGDVLRPDISVILKDHYSIVKGHIHGVPDLVVEVLSNATRSRDTGIKADRYLRNGVREYWVVDPDAKTIALWANRDRTSWEKKEGDTLESLLLPGFVLTVEMLFPDL